MLNLFYFLLGVASVLILVQALDAWDAYRDWRDAKRVREEAERIVREVASRDNDSE